MMERRRRRKKTTWKWIWFGCFSEAYSHSHLKFACCFVHLFYFWCQDLFSSHHITPCIRFEFKFEFCCCQCRRQEVNGNARIKTFYLLLNCTEKLSKCLWCHFERRSNAICVYVTFSNALSLKAAAQKKFATHDRLSSFVMEKNYSHAHPPQELSLNPAQLADFFSATCSNCSWYHYDSVYFWIAAQRFCAGPNIHDG